MENKNEATKDYWRIPVTYSVSGVVKIPKEQAKTLKEAMVIAQDNEGNIPLPNDPVYVDGSWELSYGMDDIDIVRSYFNDNDQDITD